MAGDVIKVKWAEVSKLAVSHPIPFHLEGSVLIGTAEEGEAGTVKLKAGPEAITMIVPMNAVTQVNPVTQPPVIYNGESQRGLLTSDGEQPTSQCEHPRRFGGSE